MKLLDSIVAVVPAAGVGSRMKIDKPKQYLTLYRKTILEHTVEKLLSHQCINKVVVAIADFDPYYSSLFMVTNPNIIRVAGGKKRVNSVLLGIKHVQEYQLSEWVIVHDAVRPCIQLSDIDKVIASALKHDVGAVLALPVRDTIKRANKEQNIRYTVNREKLWHALTPQMFKVEILLHALNNALDSGAVVTDESSALELLGKQPALVLGRTDNIKITYVEDLNLAKCYLFQT
ncbi:2-C-methyl-D-erythritol 4-phosphate cytidylyltransferase [Candidatus Photodesmus blepharus]|uniref:2-C-methyl-D-erythritol 4-phosphate cytidylyltransferase n=1 Tax=Candidatus Photodesmus blepharonis TaxID=1179155 RepID=A0A084CMR9_9GAMM|nr:2-C-methyl-D-erythritol 4-phosphate cytidylyltransferase [Candidatus Photodesmus blepharus]KEY91098.1 2-C-methyl-D-erythritol 4-phosphate cytidylyltransferase [Candidatus Photodesmus blepharus]